MKGDGVAGPVRRLTGQPGRGPTAREVIGALNHPLRRRIMRALHEAGEARSPRELSRDLRVPLSNLSYHVRVLEEKRVLALTDCRPVRGSFEHFYFSVLPAQGLAIELLDSTAEEDGAA